jgi:hypothetical protein
MPTMYRRLISLVFFFTAAGGYAESYRVEAIEFPPWVAPEVGGIGFTPDGEIVVALRRNGVLMATPTVDPTTFDWRAFSTDSLHNPCGIQVISKHEVLVSQMAELTRLTDTDLDGIADLYENVADDWGLSGNYHETNALTPDGHGGWFLAIGTASHNGPTFYHTRGEFADNGRTGRNYAAVPWKGWIVHADAAGHITPYAKGFRAHNGLVIDPKGRMFATDNQGDWRGTSPLYHIEPDNFYGHPSALVWDEKFVREISADPLQFYIDDWDRYERDRTAAAVEFPQGFMCNSPSEPVIDTTKGAFGPFAGQMFVGDVAGDRILRVMLEEVGGVMQGACVKFIEGSLGGGNNRLAFSPDGTQLYVGQTFRGWSGRNTAEGMKRITFTGETPFALQNISLREDSFILEFTQPLEAKAAQDVTNYTAKSYWYKSHHPYGSRPLDETPLPIEGVEVSPDRRSVRLTIPDLQPGRIVEINLPPTLLAEDGSSIDHGQICYTIRRLPEVQILAAR